MSNGNKFAKKGLVIAIALLLVIILMTPVAQGCDYIALEKYLDLESRFVGLSLEYDLLNEEVSKQRSTIEAMQGELEELYYEIQQTGGQFPAEKADVLGQELENKLDEISAIDERMKDLWLEMAAIEAVIETLRVVFVPCFAGDTLVLMADNSMKRISDVQVGEMVLAYDVETEQTVTADVTATKSGEADYYYLINGNLKVTPPHPFFTAEGKWAKVADLKVGDKVRSLQGLVEITSIERVNSGQRICNISVGDFHNFFVSANGKDFYLVQE